MIVIVEGSDFSGKTTLIQQLANDLNAFVVRNRKPKRIEDVQSWINLVRASGDILVICDRTALISEPIYAPIIGRVPVLSEREGQAMLASLGPIALVYCDPGKDQVMKCNNDQMAGVKENLEKIYDEYKLVMARSHVPVYSYDFRGEGNYNHLLVYLRHFRYSTPDLVPAFDFETYSVARFHDKYGVPMPGYPQLLKPDVLEFRQKFLQEELDEFLTDTHKKDLVKAFDALLDLTYVVKGTALLMGISDTQWAEGFDAVQKANMTKVRVTSAAESKRGSALDVRKPPGWVGPEETLKKILTHRDLI